MERFFLGGNSGNGFYSLYEKALAKIDRVVILKGGAGTGKSTAMKEISSRANALGYEVENWYCSGDPTSLDGVYIKDLSVAVVDGTAPHALEPTMPKIKDEIVNLADCLDRDKLKGNGEKVAKLLNDKKRSYSRVYDHLNLALCYQRQIDRIGAEGLNVRGIKGLARELSYDLSSREARCGKKNRDVVRERFSSAITPDGEVNFYDYLTDKKVYLVKGGDVAKNVFFEELKNMSVPVGIFPSPLTPSVTSGLEIGDVAVVSDAGKKSSPCEIVDLGFAEGNTDKYAVKGQCDQRDEQIKIAVDYLRSARGFHLEVEGLYVTAMDYDKLGEIKRNLSEFVFGS